MSLAEAGGERQHRTPWPNLRRLVLAVGFLVLAGAMLIAWNSPASGYEISVYAATPLSFWVGVGVALSFSAFVCAVNPRDLVAGYGLMLGGLTTLVIGALPLIRSYRFWGAADALTHLGFAGELREGAIGFTDLLYPGGHTSVVMLAEAFGLETTHAMLWFTLILLTIYLVFIPLAARAIVERPDATVFAAFSGFLLLPFNNVSTIFQFHTYSLGVLLLPFLAYLLIKHMRSGRQSRTLPESVGGWNALLIVGGTAMLFMHPQVKLNVLILIGTFAGIHVLSRWRRPKTSLSTLRAPYGSFVVLTVLWAIWSGHHWQTMAAGGNILNAIVMTVAGEGQVGQAATEAGASASAIGGSLLELFLKLFLVPSVYALLTVIVVTVSIVASSREHARQDYSVITYVGVGGIVLAPFFFLHFLGDVSDHFFRHLGFGMVLVTLLGALSMYYMVRGIGGSGGSVTLRTLGVWLLAAALILSILVLFPSPYVYLPGSHVSEGEMQGYETAFGHVEEETEWSGIRAGPGRFYDALVYDRPPGAVGFATVDGEELHDLLAGQAENDRYLPVSERDYQREVSAYQGISYEESDFAAIHGSPQANHVQSNGEFELYYVRADTGD